MPGAVAACRVPPPEHRPLLPVMNALIDAMEAEAACPVGVPAAPDPDLARRSGSRPRRLVDDLRGVEQVAERRRSRHRAGRDALIADLDGLIDLVAGPRPHAGRRGPGRGPRRDRSDWSGRLWPIQARFLQTRPDPGAGRPLAADPASGSTRSPTASTGPRVIALRPAAANRPAGASIGGCWPRPIGRSPRWTTS